MSKCCTISKKAGSVSGIPYVRLCVFACLFSLLWGCPYLIAQEGGDETGPENKALSDIIWSDAGRAAEDLLTFGSQPLRFNWQDWLLTGTLAGSVALAAQYDAGIADALHTEPDWLLDAADAYGHVHFGQMLTAGVYVSGLISGNHEVRTTGRMLFQSILYSGLITSSLKIAVGRSRPGSGLGPFFFEHFETEWGSMSFPSGHTTVAFAVSTVLAGRFDNTSASILLYSLAAMTGISRIVRGQHWLSDVLTGAAIGYFSARWVLDAERERTGEEEFRADKTIALLPGLNGITFILVL